MKNSLNQIGRWTVHALDMGKFKLDGGAMMGSVPKVLWNKTNPADELNRIQLALRCLLLDNGQNRILIETGMGSKLDDKMESMFMVQQPDDPLGSELSRIGLSKQQVTHVIITHLHFDHAGGATELNDNGELVPTFKNAAYYISKKNWQAAMKPNPRDRASYLPDNYSCLQDSDQLILLDDDTNIMEGISTISVEGHTVGQQLVKIDA